MRDGDAMAYRRAAQLFARLQAGVQGIRARLFAGKPSGRRLQHGIAAFCLQHASAHVC